MEWIVLIFVVLLLYGHICRNNSARHPINTQIESTGIVPKQTGPSSGDNFTSGDTAIAGVTEPFPGQVTASGSPLTSIMCSPRFSNVLPIDDEPPPFSLK